MLANEGVTVIVGNWTAETVQLEPLQLTDTVAPATINFPDWGELVGLT